MYAIIQARRELQRDCRCEESLTLTIGRDGKALLSHKDRHDSYPVKIRSDRYRG